jgi:Cytochrome c7 and related cytochrome c
LSGLGEAPHGSVDEVYGFLRRAKLAELNTSRASRSTTDAGPPSARDAVKTRRPGQPVLSQQQESDLLEAADQVVFGRQAERLCYHCHHIVARGETWEILSENPDVVGDQAAVTATGEPSMVPARWMLHAQFDHESHRAIACDECHAAANSSHTADILMPSIATCRACHGNGSATATGRVRADCVLCHGYHGEAPDSGGKPLDQLITLTETQAGQPSSP